MNYEYDLPLQWRHNEHDGVPNHQCLDWLLNRLFRRRPMKTSKFRVTGLCGGNSPVTDEFPAQRASNAENVSIWWRHHGIRFALCCVLLWLENGRFHSCSSRLLHWKCSIVPTPGKPTSRRWINGNNNISKWNRDNHNQKGQRNRVYILRDVVYTESNHYAVPPLRD